MKKIIILFVLIFGSCIMSHNTNDYYYRSFFILVFESCPKICLEWYKEEPAFHNRCKLAEYKKLPIYENKTVATAKCLCTIECIRE
jgi:hypothetical protein